MRSWRGRGTARPPWRSASLPVRTSRLPPTKTHSALLFNGVCGRVGNACRLRDSKSESSLERTERCLLCASLRRDHPPGRRARQPSRGAGRRGWGGWGPAAARLDVLRLEETQQLLRDLSQHLLGQTLDAGMLEVTIGDKLYLPSRVSKASESRIVAVPGCDRQYQDLSRVFGSLSCRNGCGRCGFVRCRAA